jgi:hypothetical protein
MRWGELLEIICSELLLIVVTIALYFLFREPEEMEHDGSA